jgi:hypothetical protein
MIRDVSAAASSAVAPRTRWQRLAPAFALVLLAPFIAEVLSGATRLSILFVFIPEVMVWGVGALLIREAAVRWRSGWTGMLLMGLGLSVAEEFVIQQTSIAPLPWMGTASVYGRLWGVNWPYFLFMLGYESVWVVLVPVLLTYLLYPKRREEPWVRPGGLFVLGAVFSLGSFVAWYSWTQRARPMVFHVPKYVPPTVTIAAALVAIGLLVAAAYLLRSRSGETARSGRAPNPWIAGAAVLLMGFPWYVLMTLVFAPKTGEGLPLLIPMVSGCIWGLLSYVLLRYWASMQGWSERHEWALVLGAVLVSMVAGFSGSSAWPRMDIVFKAMVNVAMTAWLVWLGVKIRREGMVEQELRSYCAMRGHKW